MKVITLLKVILATAAVVGGVAGAAVGISHRSPLPQVDSPNATAAAPAATNDVKVIGHWHGYNVYNVPNTDLAGTFPISVGNSVFTSMPDLASNLTPVKPEDTHSGGVICDFLCTNPEGQVIGYDAAVLANIQRLAAGNPTTPAAQEVDRVDGSTDSDVPTGVIRSAINANSDFTKGGVYPVQTWKETNTYTRKIEDETIVIIELHATFHLRAEDMALVGPDTRESYLAGKKYTTAQYVKDGQVALVKRGHDWYIYKG